MAAVRRPRRLVESLGPEIGQPIYGDEVTGEIVTPEATVVSTECVTPVVTSTRAAGQRSTA